MESETHNECASITSLIDVRLCLPCEEREVYCNNVLEPEPRYHWWYTDYYYFVILIQCLLGFRGTVGLTWHKISVTACHLRKRRLLIGTIWEVCRMVFSFLFCNLSQSVQVPINHNTFPSVSVARWKHLITLHFSLQNNVTTNSWIRRKIFHQHRWNFSKICTATSS